MWIPLLSASFVALICLRETSAITIGKFGSFHSNSLLGRPYHLTYELLDKLPGQKYSKLRIVPPAELHAETISSDSNGTPAEAGSSGDATPRPDADVVESIDVVDENGQVVIRNNRLTIDNPNKQALSMSEIEALKKAEKTGSGKEIIAKIMAAHGELESKTEFALAKYTLRKSKKFLKRFTVLPLDVGAMTDYITEKEALRIMEIRMETLGLMTSWANVHYWPCDEDLGLGEDTERPRGRYLAVDDTGGLLVAAMAEKMGLIYEKDIESASRSKQPAEKHDQQIPPATPEPFTDVPLPDNDAKAEPSSSKVVPNGESNNEEVEESGSARAPHPKSLHQSATHNTITVIHPNTQPNISMLSNFGYKVEDPSPSHPLYRHLKTITWLQLLDPDSDQVYSQEPDQISSEELFGLKSGKRSAYHRKRRRWERVQNVVADTQAGDFDGLLIASWMDPVGILKHLVPLLRGGAMIAVFSPTIEPLTQLADCYSRERKGAWLQAMYAGSDSAGPELDADDEEDFPINPTLVLNPAVQTTRAIEWQVLPGRTHPMMTSRGGAEGYIFTATRVLPTSDIIKGKGNYSRKRKTEETPSSADQAQDTKKLKVDD